MRERKAMTDRGGIETTGYEKFQDGMKLSLALSRVSADHYAVDFDLDVSTFDQSKKSSDIGHVATSSVLKSMRKTRNNILLK